MHTEIRFHGDPPTYRERRIIPARTPRHAREMERQLRAIHRELLERRRAILARLYPR